MKDTIKPVRMPIVRVKDRIHGHTRFDFFDVNTKAYKRVESDNIVTDAVEEFLKSYGTFKLDLRGRYSSAGDTVGALGPLKALFGGLFLFDTTIPITAKYMPAGTTMIGNGAMDVSNPGNCTEFGSYNAAESSVTDTTATMVYDFSTSQGNGDIACVCLSSYAGGYIGWGNKSGYTMSTKYITSAVNVDGDSYGRAADFSGEFPQINSKYTQILLYWNNLVYGISGAGSLAAGTTQVTISVKNKPVTTLINPLGTSGFEPSNVADDSFTVSFSSLSVLSTAVPYKNKFYIVPANAWNMTDGNIGNGSKFQVIEINVETRQVTEYTVTNNSGEALFSSYITDYQRITPSVLDDTHLLFKGASSGTLYSCKFDDSTFTSLGVVVPSNKSVSVCPLDADGHLLMDFGEGNADSTITIMDTINHTRYPINAKNFYQSNQSEEPSFLLKLYGDYEGVYAMLTNKCTAGKFKLPMYLATINNLDSPVTKTANLTMKVTYTLTME